MTLISSIEQEILNAFIEMEILISNNEKIFTSEREKDSYRVHVEHFDSRQLRNLLSFCLRCMCLGSYKNNYSEYLIYTLFS